MSAVHSNISIFVPHLGCPNQCSFCNQHHIACTEKTPDVNDIDTAVSVAKKGKKYDPSVTEIAFFGGSFTAIDREYMIRLLSAAKKYITDSSVCGIRISTRPDAINDEILDILKEYGVTTIELGAQSMVDSVLSANERGHTSSDVIKASKLIKSYGFDLGLQMMTGLYCSCESDDVYTAERLISLSPDCVRIYPTITLKNTKLAEHYQNGRYIPPTLDQSVELCVKINKMFEDACIPVIRLGLHTIDSSAYVAGPWHPAFKELCDSVVFRRKITERLKKKGSYTVFVNKSDVSKAVGQSRQNILFFKENGYDITIKPDETVKKNDVIIKGCE